MIDVGSLLARDAVLGAVPTFGESVEACDEVAPALIYDYRGFDEVFVVYLENLVDVVFGGENVWHPYLRVIEAAVHGIEGEGDDTVASFDIAGLDDVGFGDIE